MESEGKETKWEWKVLERSEEKLVISFSHWKDTYSFTKEIFTLSLRWASIVYLMFAGMTTVALLFGASKDVYAYFFVPLICMIAPLCIYVVSHAVPATLFIMVDKGTRRMNIDFFIDVNNKIKSRSIPFDDITHIYIHRKKDRMGNISELIARLANGGKVILHHNWRKSMDHLVRDINQYLGK